MPDQVELSGLLDLLLHEHPTLLSGDEIMRELGFSEATLADALAHVEGMGLAHSLGGFVWATRAAMAADELST
jgi:hypothetical protein